MSVYLVKRSGWRYDFVNGGERHTSRFYRTKREARAGEVKKRKEMERAIGESEATQTATAFLTMVNRRLDWVRAYRSEKHYRDSCSLARRWVRRWGEQMASAVTQEMIEEFLLERSKVSANTANKELRYLRATFNFAKRKKPPWVRVNPTDGIEFFPTEERLRYVPPAEHIEQVIAIANQEQRDYLTTIRDSMARVGEINQLEWQDVDLAERTVTLYTRKKKGGHKRSRKVAMTKRLYARLKRRFGERDKAKPWVFWHSYTSSKTGEKCQGPYLDRKKFMRTLCRKAGVPYFRFHALRHGGASMLNAAGVPIGVIQQILGHENRSTTEIYLHRVSESERQAMARFEQELRARVPHKVPHSSEKEGQNGDE